MIAVARHPGFVCTSDLQAQPWPAYATDINWIDSKKAKLAGSLKNSAEM